MAERGPGHVHSHIAHADDCNRLSKLHVSRIFQIGNAEMNIWQAFAVNTQRPWTPCPGSDKNGGIAVTQQIFDFQSAANGCGGAKSYAKFYHHCLVAVKH